VPRLEALEDRNLPSGLMLTPIVQVSSTTPFTNTSDLAGQPGHVSLNSEVEPSLAVDPTNPQHLVGAWQQDRWSNGGARGIVAGVSIDGGNTWKLAPVPGLSLASGGTYQRASDPWVSIAPNGDVYLSSLEVTLAPQGFPLNSAIFVSKSPHTADGSLHFGPPTLLQADTSPFPNNLFNDKPSVTADPTNPNRVYVVWDRGEFPGDNAAFDAFHSVAIRQDILLATTTDGGQSWTTRTIRSPQDNDGETGNQIVVEPDGTLVDVFALTSGSGKQEPQAAQNFLAAIRSTDHGLTWSDLIVGPAQEPIGITDPNTGATVRSGEPIFGVTADQHGNLYAVWADGRFSDFTHDDIAFAMSTNGGRTWSAPIKVNQTPTTIPAGDQQAFTPSVAVAANGVVAVTYYDFRNNTGGPGLLTDYWIAHADSNFTSPASWNQENRLTDTSFNLALAPRTSRGYFVGDYEGLVAAGNNFDALFAQAVSASDPASIFFRDPPPALEGGASGSAPAGAAGTMLPTAAAPAGDDLAWAAFIGEPATLAGNGDLVTGGLAEVAPADLTFDQAVGQGGADSPDAPGVGGGIPLVAGRAGAGQKADDKFAAGAFGDVFADLAPCP
jgi:hypothetical protein